MSSVPEECRQALLQLAVDRLGAADEAHRGHPEAPPVERLVRGGDDRGMAGQAEVVVGAEVDHLTEALDPDVRRLRRRDHQLGLVEALVAHRGEA